MIKYILTLVLICYSTIAAFSQERQLITINNDWHFAKGSPASPTGDSQGSEWEAVTLPHDWAIHEPFIVDGDGNTGKLPWKGEGWYRKVIELAETQQGNRVHLIFDGVMAFPKVYVNGKLAGSWDYGYNSFYLDITDHLQFGKENILAVHVDTRSHDSRWYPGAGIYRKVQMLITSPVYVDVWGTYVTTPIITNEYADVRVMSTIKNMSAQQTEVQLIQTITNEEGQQVGIDTLTKQIKAGASRDMEVTVRVEDPAKWDIDSPHMYKVHTAVYNEGKLVDTYSTPFGIRTIGFTADDGFHLNGRRVQLKGVNLHHDHGPLGAAFNKRAMERQLQIMKAMGVNAVRNSHNTAAPEMLELCDKMGLLVFNEVFDKYDAKAGILDTTQFDAFARRNIKNFVLRDRNHPSIFLWSVGNEIGDVQWNIDNGFQRLHTMVNYVNKYDPTRPVTLVCDNLKSAALRHFDYYDVHSWNYGRRYRLARELEPDKSVIISESASTVSTRGFYEFPLPEKPTDFTPSLQVSSYDVHAPWWAELADDDFMWQQQEPYIAGEFVWTGFDYLGEPTPYNNEAVKKMGMSDQQASRSSYFGIVDLVGIPKDRYYLYKSYWKPEETTVHILPHWNWAGREGKNVPVFVYTNGDCAELFINGQSQGQRCKQPDSEISTERFRLMWKDVKYQPGEVRVVAYKNDKEIGKAAVKTAGKPHHIEVSPDRSTLHADGEDLSYLLVEAYDSKGNIHPLANDHIKVKVTGAATLAGVGNGNPQSFNSFDAPYVDLFYGKAMIIVKAGDKTGKAKVTFESERLGKKVITLMIE